MSIRPVKSASLAQPTTGGAGVHLRRAFGFGQTSATDPFLLFDDFRGNAPRDYMAGFPWHPHRRIETITYVLAGSVDHAGSLGNRGTLNGGDVRRMTAGSGVLHQEMAIGNVKGQMHGFPLWADLPRALKMTDPRQRPPSGAWGSGKALARLWRPGRGEDCLPSPQTPCPRIFVEGECKAR